jgi:hypothetical protein
MLTGVELLPLGLFSLGDLQACIAGGRNVHLVLPGAMEPALARSRLAADPALASLVFVHRADETGALPAIDRPDLAIVDIDVRSARGSRSTVTAGFASVEAQPFRAAFLRSQSNHAAFLRMSRSVSRRRVPFSRCSAVSKSSMKTTRMSGRTFASVPILAT